MCERCERSNRNLIEHDERIEKTIQEVHNLLDGNYSDEQKEMIGQDPFPVDKPFMEILFRMGSAIERLAMCHALITGEAPSIVLGQLAGMLLEVEMESGVMDGLFEVLSRQMTQGQMN